MSGACWPITAATVNPPRPPPLCECQDRTTLLAQCNLPYSDFEFGSTH